MGHVIAMNRMAPPTPPVLDMTLDGQFREPLRQGNAGPRVPMSFKLLIGAVVVAVLAGTAAVAALMLWVVSLLLPLMIIAGGVAYAAFKYRQWRGRGTGPGALRRR